MLIFVPTFGGEIPKAQKALSFGSLLLKSPNYKSIEELEWRMSHCCMRTNREQARPVAMLYVYGAGNYFLPFFRCTCLAIRRSRRARVIIRLAPFAFCTYVNPLNPVNLSAQN
jgi:hypothetical protein